MGNTALRRAVHISIDECSTNVDEYKSEICTVLREYADMLEAGRMGAVQTRQECGEIFISTCGRKAFISTTCWNGELVSHPAHDHR